MKVNFCTDFDLSVIVDNCLKRGWTQVNSDSKWNIYWANIQTCRFLFSADCGFRLNNQQLINHFPNNYELCRKDLLVKNIKRYRKDLEKENNLLGKKESAKYVFLDFIPTTFVLPLDYNLFVEEYKKSPQNMWILKPCGRSQGSGIFLINKLSKVKKWADELQTTITAMSPNPKTKLPINRENYIISKYVENPLLIGGKKFDLRLYILVTSFRPLKAYWFRRGFCRFSNEKYSISDKEINNIFVHLTNVSVQQKWDKYNSLHGGKFSLSNFKLYLESTRGKQTTDRLFDDMIWIVVHSLKSVASIMINDKHCFECYGYDIIIDDNLKPWLVEINSSPSIVPTTLNDRILKNKLIDDILSIVIPPSGIPDVRWKKNPPIEKLGDFDLLIDEELLTINEKNLTFDKFKSF